MMQKTGLALPVLVQPCLPKAESQGSQGFEVLNASLRDRRKGSRPRIVGESCQACSREGLWAGVLVSSRQRSGLAALRGLFSHCL